jgi:hypothetical protein
VGRDGRILMACKVIHVEQGTDEWDALRRTRITASRLGDVLAKPNTKRHIGYKQEITLELLGHTHVEDNPEWFRHGREMEPDALRLYQLRYEVDVIHDIFLIHPEYDWLAASPDAAQVTDDIISDGMELKCRKLYKNYRKAIQRAKKFAGKGDYLAIPEPVYQPQIQGSMWVSGLDTWWYTNYYADKTGDVRIGRAPIPRNQKLIDEMEDKCILFMQECYENAGLA